MTEKNTSQFIETIDKAIDKLNNAKSKDELYMPDGETMKAYRKKLSLTMRDVEFDTLVPMSTISRIESGRDAMYSSWKKLTEYYINEISNLRNKNKKEDGDKDKEV